MILINKYHNINNINLQPLQCTKIINKINNN